MGSWVDYETWKLAIGEENVVVPLSSFTYSHSDGPLRFEQGQPTAVLCPQTRRELREGGFIA